MKNTIVLYRSKYGSAKKYAEWIQAALSIAAMDIEEYHGNLEDYDIIIFTGGIYAGGIGGIKRLKKLLGNASKKAVILLATGASPYDEKAIQQLQERNLKDFPGLVRLFYGRGIYDESAMGIRDRTLCRMLRKSLMKKDPKTYEEPWMAGLVESHGNRCDWMDRSYIEPLLAYAQALASKSER